MRTGLKVKVSSINPEKTPNGRAALESCIGLIGSVESSHLTVNGTVNYIRFGQFSQSQPFYDRELQEVKP